MRIRQMKFKLIDEPNPILSSIEQVLINRGIEYAEIPNYLHTTDEDVSSPLLFGEEKLKQAAIALISTIQKNEDAMIVVDSDCDGYTSAAVLINYLYEVFPY